MPILVVKWREIALNNILGKEAFTIKMYSNSNRKSPKFKEIYIYIYFNEICFFPPQYETNKTQDTISHYITL